MARAHHTLAPGTRRLPVNMVAFAVGAAFLLVGVLGFIPGATTNYGVMEFAGHHSKAQLLGLFEVSVLHNLMHLAFGIAGITLARSTTGASAFLTSGGLIYLLLWFYGILIDKQTSANFIPLNAADDWLHFLLALGMIALGVTLGYPRRDAGI